MDSRLYDEQMGHYGIANLSHAAGDTEAAWYNDQVGAAAARDEIAVSKFCGAARLNRILDRAFQVHGALGFSGDFPLEHMYGAARGAHSYDGPDEVHRISVARRTLRGYQPFEVLSEHIPTRRAAALIRYPGASARY
jgi:acyl-CoA dehydrogenase